MVTVGLRKIPIVEKSDSVIGVSLLCVLATDYDHHRTRGNLKVRVKTGHTSRKMSQRVGKILLVGQEVYWF